MNSLNSSVADLGYLVGGLYCAFAIATFIMAWLIGLVEQFTTAVD